MSKINLERVRNVFKESEKKDEMLERETSTQSFLRAKRMASDQAKSAFISDESSYGTESTINPYDTTPKSSKTSKKDLLTLSGSNYRTSLLEQLVKNQNNREFNTSVLNFQDKTLTYLDQIHEILKNQYSPDNKDPYSAYNSNKEFKMGISELAKSVAELNPKNIAKAIKDGLLEQSGLSTPLAFADMGFDMLKNAIKEGELGKMVKSGIQDALIKTLPEQYQDTVNRFRKDPVELIQDTINSLALSRNSTIADFFGVHARGSKAKQNAREFNAEALAKFDNKFYTSVTKIMPDQLFKMSAFLEKLATGKMPVLQNFDWKAGDYASVADLIKKYMDSAVTNEKATDSLHTDILRQLEDVITNDRDSSGVLNRKVKRDSYGYLERDSDGNIVFSDSENLKSILSSIIASSGSLNELRGNPDIDRYMKRHNLGYKTVAGKSVAKSPEEIANVRSALTTLQSILNSMNPSEATKINDSLNNFKSTIQSQPKMESYGYGSNVMETFADVLNGKLPPEAMQDIFGPSDSFGTGGFTQGASTQAKSSSSYPPNWNTMSDYERSKYVSDYMKKNNRFGDTLTDEIVFKRYTKVNKGETTKDEDVRNAYEHGIITLQEYTDYTNGNRDYDSFRDRIENYKAAIDIFNDLEKMALTASQMRSANSSLSIKDYESLGYISSPEQLSRYVKSGKLDIDALSKINPIYNNDFAENLKKTAKQKEYSDTNINDPLNSMDKILASVFGDPKISKKAGIAAGSAAGLGIAKLLKSAGIVNSPKLGYLLGGVGAALMMTEKAQNMVKNVFGPEGDVQGANGFTNREIFMSKLMTRWLPAIGVGGKTAQMTLKVFKAMGPMGALMGIPASIVTGLSAGFLAPKLVDTLQKKMFSDEAKEKGGFLSKVGTWIEDLHIPFVDKYIIGKKEKQSDIDINIAALKREYNRIGKEIVRVNNQLKSASSEKEKEELTDRLNTLTKEHDAYEQAIRSLNDLKAEDIDEETAAARIVKILNNLDNKLSSESVESRRTSTETARSNANFDARQAANSKFNTTADISEAAMNRHTENGGSIDDDIYQRLSKVSSGGLNEAVKAETDKYSSNYSSSRTYLNELRSNDSFSVSALDDLISDMKGLSREEKLKRLDEYAENNPKIGPTVRDYIKSKMGERDSKLELFSQILSIQRALYPNKSEAELQQLANAELSNIISRQKAKTIKEDIKDKGAAEYVWEDIKSRAKDTFKTDSSKKIKNRGEKALNRLYDEINNDASEQGGEGTEGDNKIIKMNELKDVRFKNGTSLSEAGCSVVAFNNALYYLGIPQVDINTLVSVANNYLTGTGGVTSEFFLEMCSKLNISAKIYNSNDNKFSLNSLRLLAPDKNRTLIALLKNTNNSGAHFITIKSIGTNTSVVNDPEVNGTIDMSNSTIISRVIEFIVISKTAESTNALTESRESKSFAAKAKEWFAKTKAGKAVTKFKETMNKIRSVKDKVTDMIANPGKTVKDFIGSLTGSKASSKENTPSKTEELLNKIIEKLDALYTKPLPVSIWSDATLALQSTDEKASQVLADSAIADATNQSQVNAAQKIKKLRRRREIQNERAEAQAVQDAIINGENLRAGTSTQVGGMGTAAASVKSPDATKVDEPKKKGLFSRALGWIGRTAIPFLTGAGIAATPMAAAGALTMPYIKTLPGAFAGLFKKETDNVYDSQGNVIQSGRYKDVSGLANTMNNIGSTLQLGGELSKHVGRATAGLANMASGGFANVAAKTANIAQNSKGIVGRAAGVTSKFTGFMSGASKLAAKGASLVSKVGSSASEGVIGKILERLKRIDKWPFGIGKLITKIISFIGGKLSFVTKFLTDSPAGKKMMEFLKNKATQGLSGQVRGMMKSNLVFGAFQAFWSIVNGFRVPHKWFDIHEDLVDNTIRFHGAWTKFLWDAAPTIAVTAFAAAFAAAGMAPVASWLVKYGGLVASAFQLFFGKKMFLNAIGFGDQWKQELMQKKKKEDEESTKEADEKTKEDNEKELSEEEKEQLEKEKDAKKDASNLPKGTAADVTENADTSKDTIKNIDVTKIADEAHNHEEYKFSEKSLLGMWERRKDKGQQEIDKAKTQYGEEYDTKRKEEIANSPAVKAAMEAWQKNPGEFFHPMGDPNTKITSVFGPRNISGGSRNHKGVDFSSNGQSGKPVYAYKAGKVITSNKNYGLIEIQHADGSVSRYMHLAERFPEVGKDVAMGEVIGTSGGTGKNGASSYIPHLHFELKDPSGTNLDPFLQMSLNPKSINVAPANKNQENISYFERYPWLKEKDTSSEERIERAEKQAETDKSKDKVSIKNKDAGGPPESDPSVDNNYKSLVTKNEIRGMKEESGIAKVLTMLGTKNKDEAIVSLLEQQVKLTQQNNALMQNMIAVMSSFGEILNKNSNNDMSNALSMARY